MRVACPNCGVPQGNLPAHYEACPDPAPPSEGVWVPYASAGVLEVWHGQKECANAAANMRSVDPTDLPADLRGCLTCTDGQTLAEAGHV